MGHNYVAITKKQMGPAAERGKSKQRQASGVDSSHDNVLQMSKFSGVTTTATKKKGRAEKKRARTPKQGGLFFLVMAYNAMAYIVMTYTVMALYSYGPKSYSHGSQDAEEVRDEPPTHRRQKHTDRTSRHSHSGDTDVGFSGFARDVVGPRR